MYVYIVTNKARGTLYIGVTNDLVRRIEEHKTSKVDGFTKKYGLSRLVYYEVHRTPDEAIRREKNMKAWKRAWKIRVIEEVNPVWKDLSKSLLD